MNKFGSKGEQFRVVCALPVEADAGFAIVVLVDFWLEVELEARQLNLADVHVLIHRRHLWRVCRENEHKPVDKKCERRTLLLVQTSTCDRSSIRVSTVAKR